MAGDGHGKIRQFTDQPNDTHFVFEDKTDLGIEAGNSVDTVIGLVLLSE